MTAYNATDALREQRKAKQAERDICWLVSQQSLGMIGTDAHEVLQLAAKYGLDLKFYVKAVLLDEIRREGGRTLSDVGVAHLREDEDDMRAPRVRRRRRQTGNV